VTRQEGETKHPLILAAGVFDERVETAIYDANLERIEAALALRPNPAGPPPVSPERENGLSSLFGEFLGCLRELRERNPKAFEELETLALTGDAGPAVAEGGEDTELAGGPRRRSRLRPSNPLFLSLKDYVFFALTGVLATDPTTASSSGLFDVRSGGWRQDRLKALGIGADWLPRVVRGGGRGEPVLVKAPRLRDRALHFKKPLPVLNDTNTLSALHVGAGAGESGDLLISLRGRDFVSYLVDAPGNRPCAYLLRFQGEGYHAATSARGAGEYLRWGSETFSPGHARGNILACGGDAAGGPAGVDPVAFCPFSGPEIGGPGEPPGGVILGLTLGTAGGDILRGILEGSALELFDAVRETGGEAASRVFLCAATVSGRGLAAALANLLNMDVRLVRRSLCSPLAGCVLNALHELGAPMTSARDAGSGPAAEGPDPAVETTLRPDPESRALLLGRLRSVSSLRESMKVSQRRLSGI
jgi:hypothetical protein